LLQLQPSLQRWHRSHRLRGVLLLRPCLLLPPLTVVHLLLLLLLLLLLGLL
jgi:hypothetical protein